MRYLERILLADYIVLMDETRVRINTKFERLKDTLEAKGFRLSRLNTEYLNCDLVQAKVVLKTK